MSHQNTRDSHLVDTYVHILKSRVLPQELEAFKNTLKYTVTKGFPPKEVEVKMYQQTSSRLIVPRTAGLQFLQKLKNAKFKVLRPTWQPNHARVQMSSRLRNYQVGAKDVILNMVREIRGCVLAAHCSFGKTVTILHTQHALGGPMICLVPNNAIAKQWGESIENHVANAVVMVKPTFPQVEKYMEKYEHGSGLPVTHVVLTVQSVIAHAREELPPYMLKFYDQFSTLIVDEAHFIPAAKFRTCVTILGHIPYRIALTATPDRDDGHHHWLFATFGPIAYQSDPKQFHTGGKVELLNVNPFDGSRDEEAEAEAAMEIEEEGEGDEEGGELSISTASTGPNLNCYIGRVQAMVMKPGWNLPLVQRVHEILTRDPSRCTIILTFFTQHALLLREKFTNLGYQVFSLFSEYRDVTNQDLIPGTILIASYSLGSTGNDFKNLNTLVLASPMKKVEQSVGRILRNPRDMLVVDVIYNGNKTFRKQLERRKKAYAHYGFDILPPVSAQRVASAHR